MAASRLPTPSNSNSNSAQTPSLTALAVLDAFKRGFETHGELIDEEDKIITTFIVNYVIANLGNRGYQLFSYTPYRLQHQIVNYTGGEAFDEHMISRKMLVRDKITAAIHSGVTQIIFLAGGYDPRSFLVARNFPQVNIYDLDRGPTRQLKLAALKQYMGVNTLSMPAESSADEAEVINGNLFCINADFICDDIESKLKNYHFSKNKKTLIIAEGLTSYLDEATNKKLLQQIANLLSPDNELLITFVPEIKHTNQGEKSLKASNEEYKFALPPEQVAAFVQAFGFEITQKGLHPHMLGVIGETAAKQAHKAHPEIPKAHFFTLRRLHPGEVAQIKPIKQIQNFNLDMHQRSITPTKSNCCIS